MSVSHATRAQAPQTDRVRRSEEEPRKAPKKAAAQGSSPEETWVPRTAAMVFSAAARTAGLLDSGADAPQVAKDVVEYLKKHPDFDVAFGKATSKLASAAAAGSKSARVASAALPHVADGKWAASTLKAVQEIGVQLGGAELGMAARRVVGAVFRGMNTGGTMAHATAEVTATLAKILAKAGSAATLAKGLSNGLPASVLTKVSKGVGKGLPLFGNAANLVAAFSKLKMLVKLMKQPDVSLGQKIGHTMHFASLVAGCFIPEVGLMGDVAAAAARRA
jgi:hypothetical protein